MLAHPPLTGTRSGRAALAARPGSHEAVNRRSIAAEPSTDGAGLIDAYATQELARRTAPYPHELFPGSIS